MNAKIIKKENSEIFEEKFSQFGEAIDGDIMATIGLLLEMPEEDFAVLGPNILQSYLQSINNPTDRLVLVQSLNATGGKAEDLLLAFSQLSDSLDQMETLSATKKDFIKQLIGGLCNAIKETEGIAKRILNVPVELCHPDAKMPQYAHDSDSGMDVFAVEDIIIKPGETKLVPTGIKMAIPNGYEIQVRPKSGRALKTKLRIANSPGTLDAGYRQEIKIIVENIEAPIKDIHYDFDNNGMPIIRAIDHGAVYYINKGEKFCQFVLAEVPKIAPYIVSKVDEIGGDRGGGFGSTGLT